MSEFLKVPIENILSPLTNGGCNFTILKNRYWNVTKDNCVLFFKGYSPQCNINKSIVERNCPKNTGVKLIDLAYIPTKHYSTGGHDYDVKKISNNEWFKEEQGE